MSLSSSREIIEYHTSVTQGISVQDLSVVKRRILRSQKHVGRGDFAWLSYAAQLRLLPKSFHLLLWPRRRLKRGMYRPRRDCVHPDAFGHQLLRQRLSKRCDRTLGCCVVDHGSCATECDCGRRIDDPGLLAGAGTQRLASGAGKYLRTTFLHVTQCILCHGKHLQDIAAENALHIVQVDVLDVLAHHLL